ncbi:Uv-b-induced protein, partial [Thalictrum thalictroides]
RIAELKENECQIAVEDVMYMSIVHKFSEIDVPMIPKLSRCIIDNRIDIWPSKCRELESIHNLNVQEMIGKHFATVVSLIGNVSMMDGSNRIKIDRLHLGQIYASTIIYGYFLKSACLRHQLELCLAQSHRDLQPEHGNYPSLAELYPSGFKSVGKSEMCHVRHENLSSYVVGFDTASLQICARLKSKEAMNLIKKHTWALFGGGRIGEGSCANDIVVTLPSLKRLVLEAVTFGAFLWDVERSVDYVYKLREN